MENKGKNIFGYLIPVVAIVIIVESVMVVSGLVKKEKGVDIDSSFRYQEAKDGELESIVDLKKVLQSTQSMFTYHMTQKLLTYLD